MGPQIVHDFLFFSLTVFRGRPRAGGFGPWRRVVLRRVQKDGEVCGLGCLVGRVTAVKISQNDLSHVLSPIHSLPLLLTVPGRQ